MGRNIDTKYTISGYKEEMKRRPGRPKIKKTKDKKNCNQMMIDDFIKEQRNSSKSSLMTNILLKIHILTSVTIISPQNLNQNAHKK